MPPIFASKNQKPLDQINSNFVLLALFLICCLGSIRIIHLNHSFWLDEITASWVVGGNFSDIFSRCWINNLSPLYFFFLYLSKNVFGYSEFSLRIPGLITGILTIPIIYKISYKLNNSVKLSLFAALLTSIDFWLVYYSLEVRPYSFVIFFSSLHIYIFLKFLEKSNKLIYASILGLLSGFIILLHYTAATLCITEFVIAIFYFYKEKIYSKSIFYGLLIYTLIPVAILLPFIPHIKYLLENKMILGSFIHEQDVFAIFEIYPHFINYMLLPIIITFFIEYPKRKNTNVNIFTFEFFFILSWYFIPILIHWILTDLDIVHIFRDRYLAWIMPAPIIGSVIIIKNFQSRLAKCTFIIVLLLLAAKNYFPNFGIDFINSIIEKNYQQNVSADTTSGEFDWKEAVDFINKSNMKLNKIYVMSGLVEAEMLKKNIHPDYLIKSYLLATVNSIYKLDQPFLNIAQPIVSVADIPITESNYLVITSSAPIFKKNSTNLSPNNSRVHIFYIK